MARDDLSLRTRPAAVDLVYGRDVEVADWVARQLDLGPFTNSRAIGVSHKGALIAGVVYSPTTQRDMEMTLATTNRRWCTRRTIFHLLYYPFVVADMHRCSVLIRVSNERAIDLVTRLGFNREGLLREWFAPGEDAVICGLLRRDCKWIGRQ